MRAFGAGPGDASGPGASGGTDAECACPCHRGVLLQHVVPCCRPCPHCRRRVPTGSLAEHVAHAHPGAVALS